jgi:hypothetical protein
MKREIATSGGHGTIIMNDNHIMPGSAASPLRRLLLAPFTKRVWTEVGYTLVTLPLAFAAVIFTLVTFENGLLWAISAPGLRKFGAASRFYARELLGEDVPAPPRLRSVPIFKVRASDDRRLAQAAAAANGRARVWETRPGVTIRRLSQSQVAELAAGEGITIHEIRPGSEALSWLGGRILDPASWRARGYFAVKLPLALAGVAVAAAGWLGGPIWLTFSVWRGLVSQAVLAALHADGGAAPFWAPSLGAALLLAAPWLLDRITEADRRLVRGLLGPGTPAERVRALEESRARVVDDSAARLRTIERDLHDGTQAQLVALAMKLGLAREKLADGASADLARVTRLVEDAHRGALEAIADLRTLARGIHPAVRRDRRRADAAQPHRRGRARRHRYPP